MSRYALLFGSLLLPAVAFFGCGDECSSPDDCDRDQSCYQGTCQAALYEGLACVVDDDCGEAPPSGNRRFVCIVGRCALGGGTTVIPDAGTSSTADAGP